MLEKNKVVGFSQVDVDMVHRESLKYKAADLAEEFVDVKHGRGLAGDVVDGLQLRGLALFERIEACVLDGNRGLRGEEHEQVNRFGVEEVSLFALAIENADHFVADDERYGQFGARG